MVSQERRKAQSIFDGMSEEQKQEVISNAIDSWMDKKFALFGKWTLKGIGAAAFSYAIYWVATHGGFKQ